MILRKNNSIQCLINPFPYNLFTNKKVSIEKKTAVYFNPERILVPSFFLPLLLAQSGIRVAVGLVLTDDRVWQGGKKEWELLFSPLLFVALFLFEGWYFLLLLTEDEGCPMLLIVPLPLKVSKSSSWLLLDVEPLLSQLQYL